VIPYYGYARQDRKDKAARPISAKLVAKHPGRRAARNRVLTMTAQGGNPGVLRTFFFLFFVSFSFRTVLS